MTVQATEAGRAQRAPEADMRRMPSPGAQGSEATRLMAAEDLAFAPGSYNPTAGTVDVVWSTGVGVRRYDWLTGKVYDEELDLAGADLSRLNSGAPVLLDHWQSSSNVVGSVVPGSARIEAGKGVATLRFDRTGAEGQALEAKVAAGHLRHVSIGYRVPQDGWEKLRAKADGDPDRWIARRWEVLEISFVPVPADAQAAVRAASAVPRSSTKEPSMSVSSPPADPPADSLAAVREQELARARDIRAVGQTLGLTQRAEQLVADGVTVEEAQRALIQELARLNAGSHGQVRPAAISAHAVVTHDHDAPDSIRAAAAEAIAARIMRREPQGAGQRFRGFATPEIAREFLERRGVNTRGWSAGRLINDAMARGGGGFHTTSDFPQVLGVAGTKALVAIYVRAQSPLRAQLCGVREVPDYKQISVVGISDFPALNRVPESGEVEYGTLAEMGEVGRVSDYARNINVSNQALANDDLSAFATAIRAAAVAAAEAEATVLVDLLTSNSGAGPTLRDGTALFATARGNLAASGTALDTANLSAGRMALRQQRSLDGAGPIAIEPTFILVGPARETAAQQVVGQVMPASTSNVNPFTALAPLVEPRLSGNAWYLFGRPEDAPVLEIAYLSGQTEPLLREFEGPDNLGLTLRAQHSFGAYVVGWRGSFRNPGA